ncbi:unnamed protein product [Thelazia callipaeda]|uniref:MARVEL domain-containing protein n=1 Tax=Thelazia callipaeda TaxID=103827 RepID=A0A0N5D9F8_THECL|nr:unnamed protein product [Thelazia callipaeda]
MRCCGLPFHVILTNEVENDSRSSHRCCGGNVHIKQATLYVAISALLLSAFNGISMFFGVYSVNFSLDVLLLIANTITATMIFFALYYEKAVFLIPFIITSVSTHFFNIAECAGFCILALYTLYYTIAYKKQTFNTKVDQMIMVVTIFIGIIIAGWATFVVAKCYNYLKDQNSNSNAVMYERCLWR